MAKVFLDANLFVDFIEKRRNVAIDEIAENSLFISPLSIHILSYLYKYRMPEKKLENVHEIFTIIPFNQPITILAIQGPTSDFEDNVQLHSAADAACDLFLTSDAKLLDMKFFGKTQVVSEMR